ncbi:flavin-containing amine oxidoreductase-domain containing protein [Armillaria mellea]|nr:flavin-containing amine oxidoreductase-domain containing protein [Armillaria mellea]
MVSKISKPTPNIKYNKRVTSITPTANGSKRFRKPLSVTYSSGRAKVSTEYDYVISTIPLPALRFVDLDRCNLSYAQLEGMRTLRYSSSCKVGMRFSSRWWQSLATGPIKGGQTKTDRIVRTVVFPSYGIDDPNADAVMIASYTWSQDAARLSGLMNGRNTTDEQLLIDSILKDLAALHGNELQDWYAWDWYSHPFTLGAFALFGPGQFKNIYPSFGQGAAGGRLLFAGEAISDQHAWVEGALDSAYEAVRKILEGAGLKRKLKKLEANWSNPHLDKSEAEEQATLLREQELIGALFSTISDHDKLKDALLGLRNEGDLMQSFHAAQVAQKA